MKKRIRIPRARFDIYQRHSLRYLFAWLIAPIKPFLFTNICKIRSKKVLAFVFRVFNVIFRWPIRVEYDGRLDGFTVKDGEFKLSVKRARYISLYSKGIRDRLERLSEDYHLDDIGIKEGDLVIDVGASIGEVSLILTNKYRCSTYCIEPEDTEFECLKLNLADCESEFLDCPLWSEKKQITFYSTNELHDSSCFETRDYTDTTEKTASTLSDVMKGLDNRRVKLLKLEAEGAEPEILLGGLDCLHMIDYVSADVGPERGVDFETTLVQTTRILNDHGFEFVKMGHPRLVCLYRNKMLT